MSCDAARRAALDGIWAGNAYSVADSVQEVGRGSTDNRASRELGRDVRLDLRRAMSDAEAEHYALAVPPEQCWAGLQRYWTKRGAK